MYPPDNTLFYTEQPNNDPNSDFPSSFHIQYSPYSNLEDHPIFLQHLHDLHDLLQQQPNLDSNDQVYHNDTIADQTNGNSMENYSNTASSDRMEEVPAKKSSKKDRHSKIITVNGPRDRRMRLSLDVAKKFFGLQDMLGFDKASKTVDWLLNKSKPAIRELKDGLNMPDWDQSSSPNGGANSASSTSECEVLSGFNEPPMQTNHQEAQPSSLEAMDQNLGSWSPFGTQIQLANESSSSDQYKDHIVGDSSFVMSNWSPSTFFNYQHNAGTSHEHQFTDSQCYGSPWDANGN